MAKLTQRKRNIEKRKRKSVVAIGCEGKNKTETTYFKNYISRNCIIKFAKGNCTDPIKMVYELIKYCEDEDIKVEYGDKIYLLIDTDINQNNKKDQIKEAKKLAKIKGIEVITSTPTFEYWYLLHNKKTRKIYNSSKQVKEDMEKMIKGYEESMNVYPLIYEKTETAIENAKWVNNYHKENGEDLDSEKANPHTNVYKVVEELLKRNKEQEDK